MGEFYCVLYNINCATFNYFDEDPNNPIPSVLLPEIIHCLILLKLNKTPDPMASLLKCYWLDEENYFGHG